MMTTISTAKMVFLLSQLNINTTYLLYFALSYTRLENQLFKDLASVFVLRGSRSRFVWIVCKGAKEMKGHPFLTLQMHRISFFLFFFPSYINQMEI